ncbi:hypothetical protein [Moorena sp. SIO4G3]|uniref:hypothetical protein n=1 Tax=Moorena sp. SIO4G3 TaxID=2607821 RepID=UPI0025D06B12|nr:hypothetical protein [Moorena sp. SIO4G3]
MTLIPCLDAAHRYSIFSIPLLGGVRGGFLLPAPCSLKTQNFVPNSNCKPLYND